MLFCSKCVFFCLHWGEDWVRPHHHKAWVVGVLQRCLSFCRFFLSPHMIMELKSDHQVLGHHSNQSPSPSIAQFGQEASSKKNPGCFKLIPKGNKDYMLLWSFNEAEFFMNTSTDVWLDANLFLSSTNCSFDPRAWFLLWYALSAVEPFIKMCVPFQIIPIQFNLPQVTFIQSLVTPNSNMNAPELNSYCPR